MLPLCVQYYFLLNLQNKEILRWRLWTGEPTIKLLANPTFAQFGE
jgi:hypothetical protein